MSSWLNPGLVLLLKNKLLWLKKNVGKELFTRYYYIVSDIVDNYNQI